MSPGAAHTEFDGHEPFLGDPNQCDWSGDTRQDTVANDATFIQNHFELNAPALQKRRYPARTFGATDFLVMAIRDVDCPLRLKSLCQQHLDGFQNSDHG